MITVHHLHQSRSFRVVWLMEELGLAYDLVCHRRTPQHVAPAVLTELHPLGRSPVVVDGGRVMFESAAILEYVIHRYGGGRLAVPAHHLDYAAYLQWLHASEGTCMPALMPMIRAAVLSGAAPGERELGFQRTVLGVCDAALAAQDYFGGSGFSAADIMMETYVGLSGHFSQAAYEGQARLPAFLARVREREAYRRAMAVTEPKSG